MSLHQESLGVSTSLFPLGQISQCEVFPAFLGILIYLFIYFQIMLLNKMLTCLIQSCHLPLGAPKLTYRVLTHQVPKVTKLRASVNLLTLMLVETITSTNSDKIEVLAIRLFKNHYIQIKLKRFLITKKGIVNVFNKINCIF